MNPLSIIVMGVALAAMIGAVGVLLINRRQDKRRGAAEDAVAKAAQDYFARFQIRARTIGALLPDDSMVLMVETPPHKKLRFSYIIEPPIKNFIRVQTGIEVARIFWRFPIPPKKTSAPEVKYADPDTLQLDSEQTQPTGDETASLPPLPMEAEMETDDYFRQHQSYHIEEVSWEDFSSITQSPAEASTAEPKPTDTKK
ncbi:MAG: hypothetical protein HZA59_08590 [Hydrogenophilales bacterium]|nr:hypothetical protein [Hydrogenophilales bacterium]